MGYVKITTTMMRPAVVSNTMMFSVESIGVPQVPVVKQRIVPIAMPILKVMIRMVMVIVKLVVDIGSDNYIHQSNSASRQIAVRRKNLRH